MDNTEPVTLSLKHRAQLLEDVQDLRYTIKEKKVAAKYDPKEWAELTWRHQMMIVSEDQEKEFLLKK